MQTVSKSAAFAQERRRASALVLSLVSAFLVLLSPNVAFASDRIAASTSYCGFGHGAADSAALLGGGGDTFIVSDPWDIYHFMFDSASPVTLETHDSVLFKTMSPKDFEIKRVNDHLVFCHSINSYELVIDSHYCRQKGLSEVDTPNNEVEEIIWRDTGEIWMTDQLFEAHSRSGRAGPIPHVFKYGENSESRQWKIRPFSEVIPEFETPASSCL